MAELDSWKAGPTRSAIEDFVARVTTGADAVPEAERVAVFDNDGTLWTEKPMPTQLHYLVQHWAAAAAKNPELADREPYRAAATSNLAWLGGAIDKHYAGDDSDLRILIAAILETTQGMSVEDYERSVAEFYATSQHLVLKRPYSAAVYQPMIELLRYLESNGFTCYIVSGGERDFMRPMTLDYYGIPPERVIGSAFGLEYTDDGQVRYGKALAFFDDGPEKPVRIWTRIGRRPIFAVGNSNGDIPMLDYVTRGKRGFGMLVHHDDDSGRGDQPYDKGAQLALGVAKERGFGLISVRDDWSTVFATVS